MRRRIHYEAAFEDYLRSKGQPYVAVDEARKAIFGAAHIKSFDAVVYSAAGRNLLVDVKGRKFPDARPGGKGGSRAWENWVTREDIQGLQEWERVFGPGFTGLFVFAYWLQGPPQRSPFADVHFYRQKHYAFTAVPIADYVVVARPRSARWQTLGAPAAEMARICRDILDFL
jgi:hypothetical protein